MNRRSAVLGLLFVFSLLGNLYQYESDPISLEKKSFTSVENERKILGEKEQKVSVCLPCPDSAKGMELKAYQLRLLECESQVSLKEQERQKYLPLDDRFKEGSPAPQLEAALLQSLSPLLLNKEQQRLEAKVECRGNVCQLELLREEGQEFKTVLDKIQSDETILAMLRDFKVYRGMPVMEDGSQIVHWKHRLLFEVEP